MAVISIVCFVSNPPAQKFSNTQPHAWKLKHAYGDHYKVEFFCTVAFIGRTAEECLEQKTSFEQVGKA